MYVLCVLAYEFGMYSIISRKYEFLSLNTTIKEHTEANWYIILQCISLGIMTALLGRAISAPSPKQQIQ